MNNDIDLIYLCGGTLTTNRRPLTVSVVSSMGMLVNNFRIHLKDTGNTSWTTKRSSPTKIIDLIYGISLIIVVRSPDQVLSHMCTWCTHVCHGSTDWLYWQLLCTSMLLDWQSTVLVHNRFS